ncbi:MAG: SapC family protein [Caulobacteraceae bacterium]|nr:SapC family protein [Caulobacteraceae bacterium]
MGEITGSVLFYSQPEPLNPQTHGKLGLKQRANPFAFAKVAHVVPLNVTEFALYALSGPVIFIGEERMPAAVLGLNAGQNMFVDDDGAYQVGVYIPAYIRRFPFVFANDQAREQLVLCIDRANELVGENPDSPFFDDKGEPTEYTKNCMQFCNDYEVERRRTESFVQLLKDLDLFETREAAFQPMNPDGTPGERQLIAEFFAVSEDKLRTLPAEKVKELLENGALAQIHAHIMSLTGWDRLIAIQLDRQAKAQPQAANA